MMATFAQMITARTELARTLLSIVMTPILVQLTLAIPDHVLTLLKIAMTAIHVRLIIA